MFHPESEEKPGIEEQSKANMYSNISPETQLNCCFTIVSSFPCLLEQRQVGAKYFGGG